MSLLFRKPEARAISYQDVWGSGGDVTRGVSVSTALTLIPVYGATGYIADQFAASPWAVFDKPSGVPVRAKVQCELVRRPGVNGLDLFSWKHQFVTSLLLWGNAYGFVMSWDSKMTPAKVVWLAPHKVQVDESGSEPVFRYAGVVVPRERLIHVPWYVLPGSVVGLSPVGLFRTQIESGVEAVRGGKNFFKRGGVPSGVLKNTAKTLDPAQAQTVKSRFVASVSSSEPFVTGMDWDYTAIGLPSTDATFLTGIKATATQVAAIYRVPPEIVGGETSGSSLTYKNLEQDQIRFNTVTLRPIAARFEAVIDPYLPDLQYVKINLDASARSDLKTRYDAHAVALGAGFKTDDEVRQLEELAPLTSVQREQILAMRGSAPVLGGNDV